MIKYEHYQCSMSMYVYVYIYIYIYMCIYIYIYIYIFLRTINAARIFCLTSGPTRSWRNGVALCYQLSNISDPFRNFFPFKKVPKPYFVSENRRYCLSLSLSASARAQFLFKRQRGAAL